MRVPGSRDRDPSSPEQEVAEGDGRRPSRARIVGLVCVALALLAIPGVLAVPAVARQMSDLGLRDDRPEFLELALVNPAGATGFVSASNASSIDFEISNKYHSTREVAWRVAMTPDAGKATQLRAGTLRLRPGATTFVNFSGRVRCDSRARLVFTADTAGSRSLRVAFRLYAYRSHGSAICTSNAGAVGS